MNDAWTVMCDWATHAASPTSMAFTMNVSSGVMTKKCRRLCIRWGGAVVRFGGHNCGPVVHACGDRDRESDRELFIFKGDD